MHVQHHLQMHLRGILRVRARAATTLAQLASATSFGDATPSIQIVSPLQSSGSFRQLRGSSRSALGSEDVAAAAAAAAAAASEAAPMSPSNGPQSSPNNLVSPKSGVRASIAPSAHRRVDSWAGSKTSNAIQLSAADAAAAAAFAHTSTTPAAIELDPLAAMQAMKRDQATLAQQLSVSSPGTLSATAIAMHRGSIAAGARSPSIAPTSNTTAESTEPKVEKRFKGRAPPKTALNAAAAPALLAAMSRHPSLSDRRAELLAFLFSPIRFVPT
jgi:hypothetical protein